MHVENTQSLLMRGLWELPGRGSRRDGGEDVESQEDMRRCQQCQQIRPLLAFSRREGKSGGQRRCCCECEQEKQRERHLRLEMQRGKWQRQAEQEEWRQQEWQRKLALREAQEQREREREQWYRQQPDRRCRMCQQLLPASAFGGVFSTNGFLLQTRCMSCHAALRERHQQMCCLCQQKTSRRDFLAQYNGYALCSTGAWISLCCWRCESAFRALPLSQQAAYIHASCQRSFPFGQVIYAEVDPEAGDIRYVGRTSKPKRRHAQHLEDALPGTEQEAWYTRRHWVHTLAEKGFTPTMQILKTVETAPLVVEWEQRYIWHGMQQGWKLLNVEMRDAGLLARARAASFDFLQVPFEVLVEQHFFPSHGLVAFLHRWYC